LRIASYSLRFPPQTKNSTPEGVSRESGKFVTLKGYLRLFFFRTYLVQRSQSKI